MPAQAQQCKAQTLNLVTYQACIVTHDHHLMKKCLACTSLVLFLHKTQGNETRTRYEEREEHPQKKVKKHVPQLWCGSGARKRDPGTCGTSKEFKVNKR